MNDFNERFWRKVKIAGADECWEWTAYRNRDGYGQFRLNGRMEYAHRVAWMLAYGPIQDGMCVLHKCDNRLCVNHAHLWEDTQAENVRDMMRKGRRADNSGERHGRAKLTESDVRLIRKIYAAGGTGHREIAEEFGVSYALVGNIVRREIWTNVQ